LKKPQGVSREVWELSLKEQVKLGAPIVPVMYTSANANRLKATPASSGAVQIKWNWETFTNSAHADATFQLNHWIRKTPGGLRPSSVNASGDYVFAQYGKKADVFRYNDEEYASLCNTDANWSREATDELLELCETFDLCWPVIADRFTHDKPLEELKARYYEVPTALIHARGLATHGTGNVHPIVAQPFNVSHERDRRAGLDVVLSRTPANEREDEALLEQAKAIEERRRREAVASGLAFAEEKSVFYVPPPPKLTSKPPPSASVSALTPSAVAAALAPKSDKMGDATAQAAAAAAGGGGGGGGGGGMDDLMAHIYQAELNRVRFLIRAYYRTRLFKIEKYAVHVVKPETNEFAKLSPQEQEYAKNYVNMLEEHFGSVLGQMPEKYSSMLQQIEEDDAEMDMVPEPNLDKHVFCRVREDRRDVMFDPNDPDNTMDLDQGDIIMVRYRFIKGLLEDGALDLI